MDETKDLALHGLLNSVSSQAAQPCLGGPTCYHLLSYPVIEIARKQNVILTLMAGNFDHNNLLVLGVVRIKTQQNKFIFKSKQHGQHK